MPMIAKLTEISDEEAVDLIHQHIADLPEPEAPKFQEDDSVRLDNGWIGVVAYVDPLGRTVSVYYLDEDGKIGGPAFGYQLEKLEGL